MGLDCTWTGRESSSGAWTGSRRGWPGVGRCPVGGASPGDGGRIRAALGPFSQTPELEGL